MLQMFTDLDLRCSDGFGETKERQSKVDETVLEHLQLSMSLNQLQTNNIRPNSVGKNRF